MRRVVSVSLFVVLACLPSGAASGSSSQHYDTGTTPVVAVNCPACTMGLVTVGYVNFPPQLTAPLFVRVDDDLGHPVPFVVCQDLNGDGFCGALGEPLQQGCGGTLSLVNFRSYAAVEVYVEVVAAICGPATSGDVTVGYL